MTHSISIIQYLKQRISENYRLFIFLMSTSIVGVLLILLAVYNTSKDLELIHEVDNLYLFAKVSLAGNNREDELVKALTDQSDDEFQIWVLENSSITRLPSETPHARFPLDISQLDKFRINERGGYVEVDGQIYTWVRLPIIDSGKHVVLAHKFVESTINSLVSVYLKRLVVPAIFYVWLMVWVGLIIHHLNDKLISQNKELEQLALYDSLTGLPNRVLLNDRMHKLIQDCQRNQRTFAVAVFDLNKFKSVNDTFGHDQRDQLLCQVAGRVREQLRHSDTFSRIGGDEFVLLLNDVDVASSICKCEHIQNEILKPYALSEGEVSIGLSIGIALFPNDGVDSVTLIRNADIAMYSIKNNGGGIAHFAGGQGNVNKPVAGIGL